MSLTLLPFENQLLIDSHNEDTLFIYSKGMGLERLFLAHLKLFSDPRLLLLVINTSAKDEEFFIESLRKDNVKSLPKLITNDVSIAERTAVYLDGGVQFVTSRILVMDLLTNRLPFAQVSAILVYKAHKAFESWQEAFILRLFKEKNQIAKIKAFSDNPYPFTRGLLQLQRAMKTLFVRKLFLMPRFHMDVIEAFDESKPQVLEVTVELTHSMKAIQTALLDIIGACIREIRQGNPGLEQSEDISIEGLLGKWFDKEVERSLDPIRNQLSNKTVQLIQDLKLLRRLLWYLEKYDAFAFYNYLHSLRLLDPAMVQLNCGWLFTPSADKLFTVAKKRVFKNIDGPKATVNTKENISLDQSPKWSAFLTVIRDILEGYSENVKSCENTNISGNVFIVASDEAVCIELHSLLSMGVISYVQMLSDKFSQSFNGDIVESDTEETIYNFDPVCHRVSLMIPSQDDVSETSSITSAVRAKQKLDIRARKKNKKDDNVVSLTQFIQTRTDFTEDSTITKLPDTECSTSSLVFDEPDFKIQPLGSSWDLLRSLNEFTPSYIVMYDYDISFIRQVEMYKAVHPELDLRFYFIVYGSSTEEQRYLTTLRKEKESFEALIREKSNLVIPKEFDVQRDLPPATAEGMNSRNAGGQQAAVPPPHPMVIVDMREFRSELPSLIYKRGIDIVPLTIEVGDYILTPEICVERKSLSDLVGSLNNGRLYTQCLSMCRHYSRPLLLIEFDPSQPFAFEGRRDTFGSLVASKLSLLLLQFPKLKIIWSQSPSATSEVFEDLKWDRPEPDLQKALAVGSDSLRESGGFDSDSSGTRTQYNGNCEDMLLTMPGVTPKNVRRLMDRCENMVDLCQMSKERLKEILESQAAANLLHSFLHDKVKSSAVPSGTAPLRQGRFKRKMTSKYSVGMDIS